MDAPKDARGRRGLTAPLITAAVVALAVCIILLTARTLAAEPAAGTAARRPPEGYLVAPYLDLDEIGARGSPYAMSECCPGGGPPA